MCGIFWYRWQRKDAYNIILTWLRKLEYRWYDSAWIAVSNSKTGEIKIVKSVWEVSKLSQKIDEVFRLDNNIWNLWIGHTRWATHWGVNEANTHPHTDTKWEFCLVHNWIIENADQLKKFLLEKWYNFYSETDTEVIAKLLEYYYNWNFLETVERVLQDLEWAYALLIINKNHPWEIIGVKFWSPLILWFDDNEFFFSSDINWLAWFAKNYIVLDDGDLVYVRWNDFVIKSEGVITSKPIKKINVDELEISKWKFKHFMLKEIFEQPEVIRRFFKWRIDWENKKIVIDAFRNLKNYDIRKVVFVWCWTSYHAWMLGSRWIQNLVWIDSSAEIASEFVYKRFSVKNTLFVFISQSWETADTIEALKLVKNKWGLTLWIVNVVWSTISRLTDMWIFTRCWVEIGVASTKAFIGQILAILLLALYLANKFNNISPDFYNNIIEELKNLSSYIENILNSSGDIFKIAIDLSKYKNFFFLWRSYQLPIAYESSLKFKEITYLHSEAYPAWELKHWPLALIDENVPTIVFVPNDWLEKENISSIKEVKARGGRVLVIGDVDVPNFDWQIKIPSVRNFLLYPFLTVVVGQLLAYYVADFLWREIDKPRNLAKSVTVK